MNSIEAQRHHPATEDLGEQDSLLDLSVPADWSPLDTRAVDTARVLAADAVQRCGSGHPGTAMSLAPLAYTLFQHVMRHDPADPVWQGRDRFVLSCGHSSLTLYLQLYLSGYGMELSDLEQLRTWGSQTPGHPEYSHTPGVEITTGPLGQGLGAAVGMAMSARRERGLLDPDAAPGESPFDHHVYVIASDGDIEEGVTAEASSLAGRQQLGNLVVIYDDNHISIEDDTAIALSEDVAMRYEAYGWHVQSVRGGENVIGIREALSRARAETDRPSFIALRTVIGFPAPDRWTPARPTARRSARTRSRRSRSSSASTRRRASPSTTRCSRTPGRSGTGPARCAAPGRSRSTPGRGRTRSATRCSSGWPGTSSRPAGRDHLPDWSSDDDPVATRKALAKVLGSIGDVLPELWGGSADLAESNNTTIKGADSFGPSTVKTEMWGQANPYGRTLHFGVREHAMGAVLNGIALHGGTRAYGGTFLIFSDYMRPAVRLAALMKLPTIYIWTHDSIGLGEDGPTHQPVEHLAALRAIPGLSVVRPADARETAAAFRGILENPTGPAGLALTRQNVPVLDGRHHRRGPARRLRDRRRRRRQERHGGPELVLIATGSEVQLALAARDALEAEGVATRVVSMPCIEWFDAQDESYRHSVLPPQVTARVAVEAAVGLTWHRFVGDRGEIVSLEHFGASADYQTLYREFGITTDAVVEAARRSLARTRRERTRDLTPDPFLLRTRNGSNPRPRTRTRNR